MFCYCSVLLGIIVIIDDAVVDVVNAVGMLLHAAVFRLAPVEHLMPPCVCQSNSSQYYQTLRLMLLGLGVGLCCILLAQHSPLSYYLYFG